MSTKTTPDPVALIDGFRKRLMGPLEVKIDGAEAYWLEGPNGRVLSPESPRSVQAAAKVLELEAEGMDVADMRLVARLDDGDRYEMGSGPDLLGMARGTFGIARPPR